MTQAGSIKTIPEPDIHFDRADENDSARKRNAFAAHDEDVRLMLRFCDGDEKAFNTLVQRHKNRIYGVLQRMVYDSQEIEDLTQEVFLRVFRSRSNYSPSAKFSTWLYRIATNLALNAVRSRKRLRIFTQNDDSDSLIADKIDEKTPAPHKKLQQDEMAAIVREAIAKLPESQRAAIILRRYENLSYDQIAEVMNLSAPAVKSLLSRARAKLKEQLQRFLND